MKKNDKTELVTKHDLHIELTILKQELQKDLKDEIESSGKKYRDDILTRLDDVMGQLADLREDKVLAIHQTNVLRKDVDDHEARITKLEHLQPAA